MTSPLRDRRRRQTARDIQQATLRLAERHGFDVVTTEMIASEAGVSVRTFFNHYANKESAAVGEAPHFREAALEAFVSGRNALRTDLEALLRDHLQGLAEDRRMVRSVISLAQETPRLMMIHIDTMRQLHRKLSENLMRRAPAEDPETLDLLAELVIGSVRRAIHLWAEDAEMSIDKSLEIALGRLQSAASLLSLPQPPA